MWKMILSDGTELTGFSQNGNNYVSLEKVEESVFAGNLSTLTLTDGAEEIVLRNAELVQQAHYEGVPGLEDGWYLCFREKTPQEMVAESLRSAAERSSGELSDLQLALAEVYEMMLGGV